MADRLKRAPDRLGATEEEVRDSLREDVALAFKRCNELDRELAAQSAELEQLRAENARLKAPVSDEEVNMLFHCHKGFNNNSGHLCDWGAIRPLLKEFVASRLAAPQKEEPHAE
jgi:hypothetical protein